MTTKNTTAAEPLVIERTFNAPQDRVWNALTDVEALRRWYFDLEEFKPEVGFEFAFTVEHEGVTYDHRCRVTEVIPQKRLAYSWRYHGHPGESLVTIELFPHGNQTTIKLSHTGIETFPATASFARTNFNQGWTHLVGISLKDYVENADREIIITRDFNAPRELVWEAMTKPEHVVNWWGPRGFSTTIETMDFRVGGIWKHTMQGPDGTKYPNKSIFKEIVKPERVVYSHGGGREHGPGASFLATWTFHSLTPAKTRLALRMVFGSVADRDFVVKEFGAIEGGKQTLERLAEHLSGNQAKPFVISREFDAPRDLVWKVCTQPEHMKEWFGPKGFVGTAVRMDFRPGGTYYYGLRSPDGQEMWGRFIYREIVPPERLVFINSFSDAEGALARNPWNPSWPLETLSTFLFAENNGKTTLTVQWLPFDATEEERQAFDGAGARAGMKQGWTGTFDQLAHYLTSVKSRA